MQSARGPRRPEAEAGASTRGPRAEARPDRREVAPWPSTPERPRRPARPLRARPQRCRGAPRRPLQPVGQRQERSGSTRRSPGIAFRSVGPKAAGLAVTTLGAFSCSPCEPRDRIRVDPRLPRPRAPSPSPSCSLAQRAPTLRRESRSDAVTHRASGPGRCGCGNLPVARRIQGASFLEAPPRRPGLLQAPGVCPWRLHGGLLMLSAFSAAILLIGSRVPHPSSRCLVGEDPDLESACPLRGLRLVSPGAPRAAESPPRSWSRRRGSAPERPPGRGSPTRRSPRARAPGRS